MKDIVELTSELIACRPVSADPANVDRATECLYQALRQEGLFCTLEQVGDRKVLFACTRETTKPDMLLNVHVDVVPGDDDQFVPRIEDGWLVGRGSNDCLGHCALAARLLVRCREHASLGVVFSADEEVGGLTTKAMVERGYAAKDMIVIIDGAPYAVAVAQKGVLTLTLTAHGKSAHASTPWLGTNAIERLIDAYTRIRDLFPPVTPPDEWHNTLVPARIAGGTAANKVPDEASMTINIRFTVPEQEHQIPEEIRRRTGLDVTVNMACPPVVFDGDTPAFDRLAACMREHFQHPIEFIRMNGATDARHFVGLGIPVAIIGTPGRDIHGKAEATRIDSLRAYEEMLARFLS